MGCATTHTLNPPCPNCAKYAGCVRSSEWRLVPEYVCSNACGERLQKKRESGMAPLHEPFRFGNNYEAERRFWLRSEIKLLKRKLRRLAPVP